MKNREAPDWLWHDQQSYTGYKLCSLPAKGLWVEMIDIMRGSDVFGALAIKAKKIDSKELANLTHSSVDEIDALIGELELRNVFSRNDKGIIVNRRMYKRGLLKANRGKAGKMGAKERWQNEHKNIGEKILADFEQFWAGYPKHVAKHDALLAFVALTRKGIAKEKITDALIGYRAVIKREQTPAKFILYPASFLRKEKWKDFLGIRYKPPL